MKLIIGLLIVCLSVSCASDQENKDKKQVSKPSTRVQGRKHESKEATLKAMEFKARTLNQPRSLKRTQPD